MLRQQSALRTFVQDAAFQDVQMTASRTFPSFFFCASLMQHLLALGA
jgi:hypothetical protein